jgi:hypothetical protein
MKDREQRELKKFISPTLSDIQVGLVLAPLVVVFGPLALASCLRQVHGCSFRINRILESTGLYCMLGG